MWQGHPHGSAPCQDPFSPVCPRRGLAWVCRGVVPPFLACIFTHGLEGDAGAFAVLGGVLGLCKGPQPSVVHGAPERGCLTALGVATVGSVPVPQDQLLSPLCQPGAVETVGARSALRSELHFGCGARQGLYVGSRGAVGAVAFGADGAAMSLSWGGCIGETEAGGKQSCSVPLVALPCPKTPPPGRCGWGFGAPSPPPAPAAAALLAKFVLERDPFFPLSPALEPTSGASIVCPPTRRSGARPAPAAVPRRRGWPGWRRSSLAGEMPPFGKAPQKGASPPWGPAQCWPSRGLVGTLLWGCLHIHADGCAVGCWRVGDCVPPRCGKGQPPRDPLPPPLPLQGTACGRRRTGRRAARWSGCSC